MELSIQERLKDLRVERGLTLEQPAEQTHLSKSALGSYEGDNLKDISHYALIKLAAHPDFPRFMADLEIYVKGIAGKQVQSATIMKQHNPGLTDPLEDFLQTVDEAAKEDSDPEQASLAFICKRLKLKKKWLKKIAQKSDLLKNPNPQRGRK